MNDAHLQHAKLRSAAMGLEGKPLPTQSSSNRSCLLVNALGLAPDPELTEEGCDLGQMLYCLEESLILQALALTGHVRAKAAKLLGLSEQVLYRRMLKHDLLPKAKPAAKTLGAVRERKRRAAKKGLPNWAIKQALGFE